MKKLITTIAATTLLLGACSSDADMASENLSKAAEQFEINRRTVFYNGITDSYMLTIEGQCSIEDYETILTVTCKTSENTYKKHYLGLSDNISYFVEQLDAAEVSLYHHRVFFRPQQIIPNIDTETNK